MNELNKTPLVLSIAGYSFLVYVLLLPLVIPFTVRISGAQVQLADAFFLVPLALWITALLAGKSRLESSRLYIYLAVFIVAMTASAVLSVNAEKSIIKLLGVIYLAVVACLTLNLCKIRHFHRYVLFALIIGGVVVGLGTLAAVAGFYAGWEFTQPLMSHAGSLPVGNYPRVRSFFANANMTCNFLNLAAISTLGAMEARWIGRRLAIAAIFLILLSSFFTISAGIGGTILSAGCFFWALYRESRAPHSRIILCSAALLSTAIFLATLVSPAILFGKAENESRPYSVRVRLWQNSVERALEYPVLGRGTGMEAASVQYETVSGHRQSLTDAHNAWLNIFGQAGVVGLAAFLALCWYLWSISRFPRDPLTQNAIPLITAASGFVGGFLYQNTFGSFEDARHLWVWIGLMAALPSTREVASHLAPRPLKP